MSLQIFDAAHYHGLDNIPFYYYEFFYVHTGNHKLKTSALIKPTSLAPGERATIEQPYTDGYKDVYSVEGSTWAGGKAAKILSYSFYGPSGELLLQGTPSGGAMIFLENTGMSPPSMSGLLGGSDVILGNAFNNALLGHGGGNWIDGGAGIDTYYEFTYSLSQLKATRKGDVVYLSPSASRVDALVNVERIIQASPDSAFTSPYRKGLALDIDGSAGQAYRLYQAAFDRKPDPKGLGGWIKFLDEGHSLLEMSSFFLQSPEFTTRHGANINNDQFVRLMYQNVLHRGPDIEGYLSWMGLLNTHQQSKEQVLIGFSESTENQAALIGVIQNGMEYIPAI